MQFVLNLRNSPPIIKRDMKGVEWNKPCFSVKDFIHSIYSPWVSVDLTIAGKGQLAATESALATVVIKDGTSVASTAKYRIRSISTIQNR